MDRSPSLPSAAEAPIPVPDAPHMLLTRGPPASNGRVPAGNGAAGSAEAAWDIIEDHDRIARGLNDIVVHRLFAAGLDLHAALGLIGDHRGTDEIHHAIGELDQAIRDLRDTIFGRAFATAVPAHVTTMDSQQMTFPPARSASWGHRRA